MPSFTGTKSGKETTNSAQASATTVTIGANACTGYYTCYEIGRYEATSVFIEESFCAGIAFCADYVGTDCN